MRKLIASLAVAGVTACASAQVSPMIISEFNTDRAIVVQNGQLVRSFTLNSTSENAMAVLNANDIRFVGRNNPQVGGQYDQFGSVLGGTYDNDSVGARDFYDGTTDGVRTFALSHNGSPFDVFAADLNWDGATSIFTPTRRCSGIAYDSTNGTLWTSVTTGSLTGVQEYALDGTLLNDFTLAPGGTSGYGLAYDRGSDTFFSTAWSSSGFDLIQISRNGVVINTIDIPNVDGNWMGIEPLGGPVRHIDYYLCDGDASTLQVLRNGEINRQWESHNGAYPIAVGETCRVYTLNAGTADGREYTLNGTPTGTTYPFNGKDASQLLDGGTDGEQFNFSCEFGFDGSYAVFRYDLNWANPVRLFDRDVRILGVTYDRADRTLWISLDGGNIQQVRQDGAVISEFFPGQGRWGALAWNPQTDTLWAHDNSSGNIIAEFSKTGGRLNTIVNNDLSDNIWGGEFAIRAPAAGAGVYWVIENQSDKLFRIDMSTLVATEVGDLGVDWQFGGLGFTPDGTLYGWNTGDDALYRINRSTGAATFIGTKPSSFGADTFEINQAGEAIIWEIDGEIYNVNLSDGSLSLRSTNAGNGVACAFGNDNARLFQLDRIADELNVANIDTGDFSTIGAFGIDIDATNVGYNFRDDNLYAVGIFDANYPAYRINPNTGVAQLIGNVTGMPDSDAQQVTAGVFEAPRAPAEGDYWVIENQSDKLFRVNVDTLVATEVGDLGVDWSFGGLGFAPNGRLYGWNTRDNSLYVISTSTGAATRIGSNSVSGSDTFEINLAGEAILWTVSGDIYDIDLNNANATLRTTTTENGVASAFGFNNERVFQFDRNADELNIVNINDGSAVTVGGVGVNLNSTNMGFRFSDRTLYTINIQDETYPLYRINPVTGAASLLGSVSGMPNNPAQQVTAGTFRFVEDGPDCDALVDFESRPRGEDFGACAGDAVGDFVFAESGVGAFVLQYAQCGGGFGFNCATIDGPFPVQGFGDGNTLGLNNIDVAFDFRNVDGCVTKVEIEYLDLGGEENLQVNGGPLFTCDLSTYPPNVAPGVTLSVTAINVQGGRRGVITLEGPINTVRIGGQEFWIDNICVDTITCRTDCDGNCVINAADVGCFLSLYFRDIQDGTLNADYDGNGVTNAADVGAFLSDYFITQGPCVPR